jgi:hypothetical protein
MTGDELALIGYAIRKVAEQIEQESTLDSAPRKVATVMQVIADGMERRFIWKGNGRFVEQREACAGPGCNDFGIGAAGWLVWQSQVNPLHEMALPLCRDCANKARRDPAFVARVEKLHGMPRPLRFMEKLT